MAKRGRPFKFVPTTDTASEPTHTPEAHSPFTPVQMQYGSTVKLVTTREEYEYELARGKWREVPK